MLTLRIFLIATALLAASTPAQTVLSNNLGDLGFSESATETWWLCSGFKTDGWAYNLNSVEIEMNGGPDSALSLELWSSTGGGFGEPDVQVGQLVAQGGDPAFFTGNGITLQPSTDYWIVMRATAPAFFNWKWSFNDTGKGDGFTGTWGQSFDAGATWTTVFGAPFIMKVVATSGPWTNLGSALASLIGEPYLSGKGTLVAGTAGEVALGGAWWSSPSLLFVSLAQGALPFKGGLLVPVPPWLTVPLATSPTGNGVLPWASWPAGLSGLTIYMQAAVKDALFGTIALSNAVAGAVP